MNGENSYYILMIIGSFVSIGLTVNAYFVKGMMESLNQVKLQTAILIEKTESYNSRIEKAESDILSLREKAHEMRNLINQAIWKLDEEGK